MNITFDTEDGDVTVDADLVARIINNPPVCTVFMVYEQAIHVRDSFDNTLDRIYLAASD